ncbi:MAG: hypothetical protein Q4B36_00530 [Tissierellia bacterium]|nr:hypothetical protein [Tissierellia bacterium]
MNIIRRDFKYILHYARKYFMVMFFLLVILLVDSIASGENPIYYLLLEDFKDMGMIYNLGEFVPPFMWIIFHILPVFAIINVLYKDHIRSGTYTILKTHSKREYFFSKIISSLLTIVILFITIFLIIVIVFIIFRNIEKDDIYNLFRIFAFIMLDDIVLCWISLFIAIAVSFRISVIYIIIQLSVSMLTNISFMIGQGSLVFKQDIFGGIFDLKSNILIILSYMIIYLILMYVIVPKYNHYGSKE